MDEGKPREAEPEEETPTAMELIEEKLLEGEPKEDMPWAEDSTG